MSLTPQLTRRLRTILRMYWLSSTTSTHSAWMRSASSFFDSLAGMTDPSEATRSAISFFDGLDDMTDPGRGLTQRRRCERRTHQTTRALRVGKAAPVAAADMVSVPVTN